MPSLTVRFGEQELTVRSDVEATIGRDVSSDLTVRHPDVSRRHARIFYDEGWWIADLGSLNGTYVGGIRVERSPLPVTGTVVLGPPETGAVLLVESESVSGAAVSAGSVSAIEGDVFGGAGTVLFGDKPQPFRDQPALPPVEFGTAVITIGTAADNDLVVDDIHTSRHHARAIPTDGGFLVEDLGSLNGTFLNAVPVQRGFMGDGDRLTIGNADFVRADGRLVDARQLSTESGGLEVEHLGFALRSGKRLIDDVSIRAARGTLTAVIGPSGAGKSTLSRLLSGVTSPSVGSLSFDGFDLQRDYEAVKTRVGLVPQEDVVHRQLTLRAALRYAAALRLPAGLPAGVQASQVEKAIGQLGLEHHRATRIERLSGGQRKRASVAMELLTEPSLLILDEPTSGLDPALDRQVMRTLRELADGDRTVIVITHSVAYLDLCDQLLVLAPGGLPAFVGAPTKVLEHFGTADWGDIFGGLADDPMGSSNRWRSAGAASTGPLRVPDATPRRSDGRRTHPLRQLSTLIARQVNLMVADAGYLAFLLALPIILGLLPAVVPGHTGLTAVSLARAGRPGVPEPTTVLALLIIGATFMGISMSIRDLVGERPIYLREKAVGLYPAAYIGAKLVVYAAFSAISAAIMTLVVTLVKRPPDHTVLGWHEPLAELFLPLALTTFVAAALGLAISAFVASNDQVMPILIVVLMVQLVLNGGLIPLLDNHLLNAVSKFVPARWGFSAAASGVDLEALLDPGHLPGFEHDPLWSHTTSRWLTDMAAVGVFGAAFSVVAWARVRSVRR